MPTIPVQTRLAPPAPAPGSAGSLPASASPATHASAPSSGLSPQVSALPSAGAAVSLRIDSLILHGFSPAEARRTGAAFEKELTRLLTESPLSESSLNPALPHTPHGSLTSSSDPAIGPWSLVIRHSGAAGAGAARALHARLRA